MPDPQSAFGGSGFGSGALATLHTLSGNTTKAPIVGTSSNVPGGTTPTPTQTHVTYDSFGRVDTEIEEKSIDTHYTYDSVYGSIASITRDYASGDPTHGVTTTFDQFDEMGRAQRVTDPNGNETWHRYDDANHSVWTYRGLVTDSTGSVASPVELDRVDEAHGYTEHVEFTKTGISVASDTGPVMPPVAWNRMSARR
jgi:hypothetical protein